jgi:hypothetical protein
MVHVVIEPQGITITGVFGGITVNGITEILDQNIMGSAGSAFSSLLGSVRPLQKKLLVLTIVSTYKDQWPENGRDHGGRR